VSQPGNFFATFGAIGFADLERLAKKSITREQRRCEALARFGEAAFDDTRAEVFCIEMLRGLDPRKDKIDYDKHEVAERFKQYPDYLPNTLADCLHELDYWNRSETPWIRITTILAANLALVIGLYLVYWLKSGLETGMKLRPC